MIAQRELLDRLTAAGKRLDGKLLVSGTEGNLSVLSGSKEVLITRSGCFLGNLAYEDFVVVDFDGNVLRGTSVPSSEMEAHLAIYRCRQDVGAVVHAHPPCAVALNLAGYSLEAVPLPEAAITLGSVPTCEFAIPGTEEGGQAVRYPIENHDAVLLDRHGAITAGGSIELALTRMETLEWVAKTTLLSLPIASPRLLEKELVRRIVEKALEAGITLRESILEWENKVLKKE